MHSFSHYRSVLVSYYSLGWESFFIHIDFFENARKKIDFLGFRWGEPINQMTAIRRINNQKLFSRVNGICIKTGQAPNLFVVDLDIREKKNGVEYLKKLNVSFPDDTVYSQTPSGGLHYYFTFPAAFKERSTGAGLFEPGSGFDCRGAGGLAIAPPSGDCAYKWLVNPFRGVLRDPPQKLIDLILDFYRNKTTAKQNTTLTGLRSIADLKPGQLDSLYDKLDACARAKLHYRSERDMDFICWGVMLGIKPDELWGLCSDVGKFQKVGQKYFDTNYSKALKVIK